MIKKATREDIDKLSVAGVTLLNDLPNYANVKVCPEHTKKMLEVFIDIPTLAIFFEENELGEIIGLFMGVVAPPWFTPDLEMSEIMFWVHPDYRKSTLAKDLMKTMETWAVGLGAKKLIMAVASGYEENRIEKFYKRLGYNHFGIQCCKEVV